MAHLRVSKHCYVCPKCKLRGLGFLFDLGHGTAIVICMTESVAQRKSDIEKDFLKTVRIGKEDDGLESRPCCLGKSVNEILVTSFHVTS